MSDRRHELSQIIATHDFRMYIAGSYAEYEAEAKLRDAAQAELDALNAERNATVSA